MLAQLLGVRPEDRRDAVAGFVTLLGVMTGHSLLETARDTLFLSALEAERLPWAYIAIALLALVLTAVSRRTHHRLSRRRALGVSLFIGALGTGAFYFIAPLGGAPSLFALYVWTGLLATFIVLQFWLLLAQVLDVGQAKRVFSFVGAGGLVGAALGSVLASLLLLALPAQSLLLAAAGVFALTAFVPTAFSGQRIGTRRARRQLLPRGSGLRLLKNEPYLRRVFWVVLISTIVVTGVDYVFKAMVSVDVATDQLGSFFARFYVVMNGLALIVQLLLAPRLLTWLGVSGSLLLLPSILLIGSVGFVLTVGLGSALVLRGADGSLRHSLNRTSTEILYLPLPPDIRDRFKSIADAIGQRGGQALASIVILFAVAADAAPAHVGLGLIGAALLWLVTIYGLRPHYLELFRRNLREGTIETHVEVSALDLNSFEALISALSSDNDYEVIGALDILASYGKTNLIPALILYHPSPEVVLRAFDLFSDSERADVRRLTARLLKHENPRIRAAALRAQSGQSPDIGLLRQMSEDESPLVSTTATVQLIRARFVDEFEGGDILRGIIDGELPEMRRALAYAARDLPRGRYAWALIRLAGFREPDLAEQVAESMAAAPDPEFLPTLVRLLADRNCRQNARVALVALGDVALDHLADASAEATLPRRVRLHLPRTIHRFESGRAVRILEERLAVEVDEAIVHKILRGLGAMRAADPSLRVDRKLIMGTARTTLERLITLLFWRVTVERVCAISESAHTPAAELLDALLMDKEAAALERVFRLMHIADPAEEFQIISTGLKSTDRRVRADSRELVANVVAEPLRTGLLALVDDRPAAERLRAAAAFYDPAGRAELDELEPGTARTSAATATRLEGLHARCLRSMLLDPSDALSSVASYRIAELGVEQLTEELREARGRRTGAFGELAERARRLLSSRPPEVTGV